MLSSQFIVCTRLKPSNQPILSPKKMIMRMKTVKKEPSAVAKRRGHGGVCVWGGGWGVYGGGVRLWKGGGGHVYQFTLVTCFFFIDMWVLSRTCMLMSLPRKSCTAMEKAALIIVPLRMPESEWYSSHRVSPCPWPLTSHHTTFAVHVSHSIKWQLYVTNNVTQSNCKTTLSVTSLSNS